MIAAPSPWITISRTGSEIDGALQQRIHSLPEGLTMQHILQGAAHLDLDELGVPDQRAACIGELRAASPGREHGAPDPPFQVWDDVRQGRLRHFAGRQRG
jgi:hypothetical protein